MSKPRGYDDRSLVSASVSKLARFRWLDASLEVLNDEGAVDVAVSGGAPESIWKGNEPSPLLTVELCDATLMPNALRLGGTSEERVLDDEAEARARFTICVADCMCCSS